MSRLAKTSVAVFTVFSFMMFSSCGNDDSQLIEEDEDEITSNVVMDMKSVPTNIMNNALLYRFDGTANKSFIEKQLNITKTGDKMTMSMPVSTVANPWNLVLLSCDTDISSKIFRPTVTVPERRMDYAKMWETGLTGTAPTQYMDDTPSELRYAPIPNVVILKNQQNYASATLTRNVAKIQVVIEKFEGFETVTTTNAHAYAELHGVPNALTWAGRLYPSTTAPQLSSKPMHKPIVFNAGKADTLNFVVPADRGNLTNPADTTKHKIKLKLSMPLKNSLGILEDYYGKTADDSGNPILNIPFVPKANGIIQIIVKSFTGEPATELDMSVTVKPWKDVEQVEDFN